MTANELTAKFGLIDFETLTAKDADKRMEAMSGKTWSERVREIVAKATETMNLPYETVPA